MTYMLLLNCALKLVEEIILYYDAQSKKHQITISQSNTTRVLFISKITLLKNDFHFATRLFY